MKTQRLLFILFSFLILSCIFSYRTQTYSFEKAGNEIKYFNAQNLPKSDFVNLMEKLGNPYLVLVFCILSLRTKDETTYPAALRLFELAKTPQEMIKKCKEDIEKAIYPVGFYKNKAGQILELSKLEQVAYMFQNHMNNQLFYYLHQDNSP